MLNWADLKEKCDHSYKLMLEQMELMDDNASFALYDTRSDSEFNTRNLYEFFDTNDISCFVIPGTSASEKIPYILHYYKGKPQPSRTEAEDDLFTQAFHLLNGKLRTLNRPSQG